LPSFCWPAVRAAKRATDRGGIETKRFADIDEGEGPTLVIAEEPRLCFLRETLGPGSASFLRYPDAVEGVLKHSAQQVDHAGTGTHSGAGAGELLWQNRRQKEAWVCRVEMRRKLEQRGRQRRVRDS
jgi:hypothetical protein